MEKIPSALMLLTDLCGMWNYAYCPVLNSPETENKQKLLEFLITLTNHIEYFSTLDVTNSYTFLTITLISSAQHQSEFNLSTII